MFRASGIPAGAWPRALRLESACAYVSMGKTKFLALVESGRMPASIKIDGITCWDRVDLDSAFEELKEAATARPNSFDAVLGTGS